jgi:hypothetical protein
VRPWQVSGLWVDVCKRRLLRLPREGVPARFGRSACSADGVRGCPRDPPSGCQHPRTYGGQGRRGEGHSAAFTQVRGYMEVQAGAVCKTVGSAYVGSNPTPATICENGPLAAETRLGGPFSSCHGVYQGVSPWVDAWQWLRTYSGQRPGGTSGAYNRSLCRSAPVLFSFPGAGLLRIPVGRFFAVLLAPGGGLPDRPTPRRHAPRVSGIPGQGWIRAYP